MAEAGFWEQRFKRFRAAADIPGESVGWESVGGLASAGRGSSGEPDNADLPAGASRFHGFGAMPLSAQNTLAAAVATYRR